MFEHRNAIQKADDLTPRAKLTGYGVNAWMDNSTGRARVTIRTLARETAMSSKTVIDALRELESGGYLTADRRDGRTTVYEAAIPESVSVGKTDRGNWENAIPTNHYSPSVEREEGAGARETLPAGARGYGWEP